MNNVLQATNNIGRSDVGFLDIYNLSSSKERFDIKSNEHSQLTEVFLVFLPKG